jgi:RimJ/RimL family protein N-acetyltransferase
VSTWPLFDLVIHTPRLELRLPHDDELVQLAAAARRGIHPPDEMPFNFPWTRGESPEFERSFLQFHWRMRGAWEVESWNLVLAAFLDGEPIGTQSVGAESFRLLRVVSTGSWLEQAHQSKGLGKEMRAGILDFAFVGLGADVATTEAMEGNEQSLGVTRGLGYEPNGVSRVAVEGKARTQLHFRLEHDRWLERRPFEAEIEGLEDCLELFGAGPQAPDGAD